MKRGPFALAVAFVLVAGVSVAPVANAAGRPICLVSNDRTHTGSTTLQAGIDAAAPGDTLVVKGTCVGSSIIDRSLTIRGVSNKSFGPATLDGGSIGRVLFVDFWDTDRQGFSLAIENLTITNGLAADGYDGGGLLLQKGTARLTNSTVSGNSSLIGGGGIWNNGAMTITNSTVSGNTGDEGGGILNTHTLTLANSIVSGNSGDLGGGIANFTGTATLANSTVSDNSALGGGGVSNDYGGTLTLTESTVTGNHTTMGSGGGISNGWTSTMTISNSTVSGNTAGSVAGGISNYGTLTFAAPPTTVGGNTAEHWPGGVFNNYGSVTGGCPVSLGGYVLYSPTNKPTDYLGFTCS